MKLQRCIYFSCIWKKELERKCEQALSFKPSNAEHTDAKVKLGTEGIQYSLYSCLYKGVFSLRWFLPISGCENETQIILGLVEFSTL